jgi:hypothetical protein
MGEGKVIEWIHRTSVLQLFSVQFFEGLSYRQTDYMHPTDPYLLGCGTTNCTYKHNMQVIGEKTGYIKTFTTYLCVSISP